MLFDREASFDIIRHLIQKPKEPRVQKDIKHLAFFPCELGRL